MNDKIKKLIVRIIVLSMIFAIFAYIFWPQKKEPLVVPEETTTTTTFLVIKDPPCLVFYGKDSDIAVFTETLCLSTYLQKYIAGYYSQLNIICRSSSDGQNVNRNNLSEKRMKALQFDLLENGVAYKDIIAVSLGDTSPYPGVDPQSSDGKILNRSCEVTGIPK